MRRKLRGRAVQVKGRYNDPIRCGASGGVSGVAHATASTRRVMASRMPAPGPQTRRSPAAGHRNAFAMKISWPDFMMIYVGSAGSADSSRKDRFAPERSRKWAVGRFPPGPAPRRGTAGGRQIPVDEGAPSPAPMGICRPGLGVYRPGLGTTRLFPGNLPTIQIEDLITSNSLVGRFPSPVKRVSWSADSQLTPRRFGMLIGPCWTSGHSC